MAEEVERRDACSEVKRTGCQGFTGHYDNQICDQPCRRRYNITTWSHEPSEMELR